MNDKLNEIALKIFNLAIDLNQNQQIHWGEIMIIFRKRNKVISDLIELFKQNKIKFYSKDYISFEPKNLFVKKFLIMMNFFLDQKNEHKFLLLKMNQIFLNDEILENSASFFLNFDFKIFLNHLMILSSKNLICFEKKFIEYIMIIFESFEKIQGAPSSFDILNFLRHIKNNETEILLKNSEFSGNEIRILTIHSSKGLEADHVIFFDDFSDFKNEKYDKEFCILENQFTFYNFKNSFFGKKIETKEISGILKNSQAEKIRLENSEEKRLLYVALTRARKKLIIVSSNNEIFEKYKSVN